MAKNSFVISYAFTGTDALLRQLQGASMKAQEAVLVEALGEAAEPIVEEARANLSRMPGLGPDSNDAIRTGALRKSLGYIVRRYPRVGKLVAYIGARHIEYAASPDMKKATTITGNRPLKAGESKVVPAKYAHLVEFGFRMADGSVYPARPFLRNAFESRVFVAEAKLRDGFAKALEKMFARRSTFSNTTVVKFAA